MTHPTATRVRLPDPEPHTGADRCPACRGAKITGDRYDFQPNPGGTTPVLVVDVLCGTCDGCGRDAAHATCELREHGDWWPGDRDDDQADEEQRCWSCYGRTWIAVQGFGGEPLQVHTLRVPCGCATPLLQEVPA